MQTESLVQELYAEGFAHCSNVFLNDVVSSIEKHAAACIFSINRNRGHVVSRSTGKNLLEFSVIFANASVVEVTRMALASRIKLSLLGPVVIK